MTTPRSIHPLHQQAARTKDRTYLFTSESVSEGHPDKLADRISDSILDHYLKYDPLAKVAAECLIAHDLVVVAGEIHTTSPVCMKKRRRRSRTLSARSFGEPDMTAHFPALIPTAAKSESN